MAIERPQVESNETVLARFVAVGRIFTAKDFVEARPEGAFREWDDARARMVTAVGERISSIIATAPSTYVREYMRHLAAARSAGSRTPTRCRRRSSTR